MSSSEYLNMSNIEYLRSLESGKELPRRLVLLHEKESIVKAYDRLRGRASKPGISNSSVDSDVLELSPSERIIKLDQVSSFLGAAVVSYPELGESRVTLGSRVVVTEDGDTFVVDMMGINDIYPDGITDTLGNDEIIALPPWTPLARLMVGHEAGERLRLGTGNALVEVTIESLDQAAVMDRFMENPPIFNLED